MNKILLATAMCLTTSTSFADSGAGILRGFTEQSHEMEVTMHLTRHCNETHSKVDCDRLERYLGVLIPTVDPFDQRLDPNDKTFNTSTLKRILLDAEKVLAEYNNEKQ